RAGAVRAIEGERTRLQHRHADAAVGTRQARGVKLLLASHHGHLHQTIGEFHGGVDGIFQALLDSWLHQQTINHYFYGVVLALVELDLVFQVYQFAIYASATETLLDELFHLLLNSPLRPRTMGANNITRSCGV